MKNIILYIASAIIIAACAFWAGSRFSLFESKTEESSQVLMEKVKKVTKLIAVEGHLSEIYEYKNNTLLDIPLFSKKALIRIKAKASIGYNFENLELDVNSDLKTITIQNIPEPELLSLEHDLDYYDLQAGVFNIFTNEDLTEINTNAKQYIKDIAMQGDLFKSAEEQKEDYIEMIKLMVESSGWTVKVKDNATLLN